jgi:hypothetical protein
MVHVIIRIARLVLLAEVLLPLAMFFPPAMAGTYASSFSSNENPISEGGRWINGKADGLDWADIKTTNGMAIGLQPGPSGFDDSTALLTGNWGPNQTVSAIVYATNRNNALLTEVEVRLRSSISAHRNSGYEVLFSLRTNELCYVSIVRWNGALNDWTTLDAVGGSQLILKDGDEIRGSITNQTIRAYINSAMVLQVTDGVFASGNPGIGFYLAGGTGVNNDFGFKSVTASDGMGGTRPAAPDNLHVVP